jgi:hypothetical protein
MTINRLWSVLEMLVDDLLHYAPPRSPDTRIVRGDRTSCAVLDADPGGKPSTCHWCGLEERT